ncbi:cytochrome c [Comamonas sp. NLF-1-9]|uniref:cytochrome c n=1 Tax=Comamonas sp. NLF-1-9 TaxID=2853163 RepID=UPI001C437BD7|nr:cytochrome c [Comamonas sp. NLF-1-9]QXL83966.1 cytochrome c [Comamonas sp. NLF-1-9]
MKLLRWLAVLALLGALALALVLGLAPKPTDTEPLQLRGAMQQMQADTEAVAAGIERQDWPAVARHAERLAHHAEPPPSEKLRILSWLFTDAPRFRNHDLQVKAAARQLQAAAQERDSAAAASSYARMQQGCDGCHNGFRMKFLAHFYGQ